MCSNHGGEKVVEDGEVDAGSMISIIFTDDCQELGGVQGAGRS